MKKLLVLFLLINQSFGASLTYTTAQVQSLLDKVNTNVYTKTEIVGLQTNIPGIMTNYFASNTVSFSDINYNNTNHYNDLRFSSSTINFAGTATPPAVILTNTCMVLLAFDNNGNDMIAFGSQMPHDYDQGKAINPHMHIVGNATIQTSTWTLVSAWRTSPSNTYSAPVTNTITVTNTAGPLYTETYASFGWLATTNLHLSGGICHKLNRASGGSATDVWLLEFDDHYPVKYLGGITNGF